MYCLAAICSSLSLPPASSVSPHLVGAHEVLHSSLLFLFFLRGCHVHGVEGHGTRGMLQHMGSTEPEDLSADCSQCCQGLEVYETCGWCPDKASCDVVHGQDGRRRHSRRRATCDYVTSQNQCWGAGCPATYSRYVGKIGAHLKRLNKTAVEKFTFGIAIPTVWGCGKWHWVYDRSFRSCFWPAFESFMAG